jgi:DNA polymerase V
MRRRNRAISKSGTGYSKNLINRKSIDLNHFCIENAESTFMIKVAGDSMIGAGINDGDHIIVSRECNDIENKIVVAAINDKLAVKRFSKKNSKITLHSENSEYPPISVGSRDKLEIWGVVTNILKDM